MFKSEVAKQGWFLDVLKEVENGNKVGNTGNFWVPHDSAEGGSKTIGYGHKIKGDGVVTINGTEYDLYTGPFPIGEGSAAFRKPFYFILNLAVGGRFTDILTPDGVTAPLPAKMYVDYVRVRKWKGKGDVAYTTGKSIANAGTQF